jgi:hypothetical protein
LVDLSKLFNQEPFASFQSSLGNLCVFTCSMKDQTALSETLSLKLEKTRPEDFVRAFMQRVCFPDGFLKDGKSKPDAPVLTDSERKKLTLDDIETFAKIYVDNNHYLFTKQEYKKKRDAEGSFTPHQGEVEHPRTEGESYVEYLFRLTLIERAKKREQAEKRKNSFSNFSGRVADNLRKNIAHGDSLMYAMERLRNEEVARRAPFDDLAKRLDQLVDNSIESSKFIVESNAIQADVAEELKKSGDSASLFSKKNIWLSIVIIVLTVINLGIAAYSTHEDSKQDAAWQAFIENALKNINGNLQNMSEIPEILRQYQVLTGKQLFEIKAENLMLREEIGRLQIQVKELEGTME